MLVSSAQATVFTLNPDGTGDFADIQTAIYSCEDGDTIQLTDGVFSGAGNMNIDFLGRDITLCSVSGNPEACILDIMGIHGNGITEQGLLFQNGETSAMQIKDITIQNADGDGP